MRSDSTRKFILPFPTNFPKGRIRNAVKRHETEMVLQEVQFFVDVGELTPSNMDPINEGEYVDWRGDRGWFDECVRIARHRGLEDGYHDRTGAENPDCNVTSNDSYCGRLDRPVPFQFITGAIRSGDATSLSKVDF
jgi:hypothetical protein